eukprot:TRINITY_DN2650_c0_g1_i4.p1 TRINITY_DN2650_c0_g1~~TRINITY_DN2650_c0_g1_i4.p1  ORF type:complete len:541 (+),score=90.76 TRINITY_DN2650_c0_g1_i4:59-1681(+)
MTSNPRNIKPTTNNNVDPIFTDFYQITMAYSYWKSNKHEASAVFDLYFRKNPFQGEFTIFCGLSETISFLHHFRFTTDHINFVRSQMPNAEEEFFKWLASLNLSNVKIYALREGSVVFPHEPLLRVEGPLAICQLLESTLLNLINFPSLVATNAARHRIAVGPKKTLIEFGMRRAQGPDGALSASRYSYIGGYDSSSNVKAGQLFGIKISGTHAHSFVTSFFGFSDLANHVLKDAKGEKEHDILPLALKYRQLLGKTTKDNELAAFLAYSLSFPTSFLALVDTYNTLESGVPNFLVVALALLDLGYKPIGIRLDSGDLAYLSKEARKMFRKVAEQFNKPEIADLKIVASSDLSEEILYALDRQGHEIDVFGIGTSLVTCDGQPALGCVYKLVSINSKSRMKLSNNDTKVTIPGSKQVYRLVGKEGKPLLDLLTLVGTPAPQPGKEILCRHPFQESKRARVTPTQVCLLHHLVWDGKCVDPGFDLFDIHKTREYSLEQVKSLREDIIRYLNPTPFKVSVDSALYDEFHKLWMEEAPIQEIQ